MRLAIGFTVLLGLAAHGLSFAQIELSSSGTRDISVAEVPAGSAALDFSYFLDVPTGSQSLSVVLQGQLASRDLDLFIRVNNPFPGDLNSINELIAVSDFRSESPAAGESIVIADFVVPEIAGARVYVGVVSFEGDQTTAQITTSVNAQPVGNLQINVDFDNVPGTASCDTVPWSDPTVFTPIAGNSATTLGEARRNAMLEAARLLSRELYSAVPITINACWEARGGTVNGATLAGARARAVIPNGPGAPQPNLLYVQAVATRQAGTSIAGLRGGPVESAPDIFITFNTDIDGTEALGQRTFYYGLDGTLNTDNDTDFLSVAMHEITHGLGFASTFDENGRFAFDFPDVFSANLVDNRSGGATSLADPSVTDADRLAVSTSVSGLQWSGPESSISRRNLDATQGDAYIRMNAPVEFQPGSSVSHIAQNYCELMTANAANCIDSPFRSLALSRPMLHEVGWAPAGDQPTYLGLMFDRDRNGHGFEFALGGQDAAGNNVYVLTFYTFETLGRNPEWFQAIGTMENGVFSGTRNDDEIGFAQFLYDDSRNPPQQADPGAAGQVVLNFNRPADNSACDDGVDRSGAGSLAVLQFVLARQVDEWCVEPLTAESTRPTTDFGGLYFAGEADTGWGFSLENIENADGTTTLFVLLYVYAADGTPVWFFGLETFDTLSGNLSFEMFQRTGFARLSRNGNISDESVGSMTLTLTQPSSSLDAGNRVSVNVAYQGSEGGEWVRDNVAIQRLSQPRP
ncbi:MAG: hypothetical protein AB8B96_09850 [Lysobacterales bacterium]